jgi:hypothetical protein
MIIVIITQMKAKVDDSKSCEKELISFFKEIYGEPWKGI